MGIAIVAPGQERGELLSLSPHLFIKLPRSGDSEVTFWIFRVKLSICSVEG